MIVKTHQKDPWYFENLRVSQTFFGSLTFKVQRKMLMKKLSHIHKNYKHNVKKGYKSSKLVNKENEIMQKIQNLLKTLAPEDSVLISLNTPFTGEKCDVLKRVMREYGKEHREK